MSRREHGRAVLALDLGKAAFKMALLEWGHDEHRVPRVLKARFLELPDPAEARERGEALRALLEGVPLDRIGQVVSTADDSFACTRRLVVPRLPSGELAGAVQWELQRFLAIPPEATQVDYEIVGEVDSEQGRKLELVASAMPSSAIVEQLALFAQVGLKVTQLVPKAAAIAAWAQRSGTRPGPVAILEMGASAAEFMVAEAGHPLFTRKIPVGGTDLTRAMTGVLMTSEGQAGLTAVEAEALKRGIGIPGADHPEPLAKGISRTQLLSLIRGALERLVGEVERSLAFYGESSGGTGVGDLLLVGGGAHLKGLPAWLEDRLGLRVLVPSPWDGAEVAPGAVDGASQAMSLGFIPALGAGFRAGEGLNLLPAELKEAEWRGIQRAAVKGAAVAMGVGLLLLWIGIQAYRRSLSGQAAALRLEQAAVGLALPTARAAVAADERRNQEPLWQELFRRLSLAVPPEAYLTELAVEGRNVMLRGRIRKGPRSADAVLADFMRGLREEQAVADLQMRHSRRLEDPSVAAEFEVGGTLP